MRINWEMLGFKRDRRSLMWSGFIALASAAAFLFMYFDREKIQSNNDLVFLTGPFEKYSWVDYGGKSGSSLTFKLKNYPSWFKIKADFYGILETDDFKSIEPGETLTVGITRSSSKHLTSAPPPFVYSVSSERLTYLELAKSIKKHNSLQIPLFAGLFLVSGLTLVYLGKKSTIKTPIW